MRSRRALRSICVQSLRSHIDRWLFAEYRTDPRSLGVYRILFGTYVLLQLLPDGLWLRNLPSPSFSPPVSVAALFVHYPPYWVLFLLNAATLFCVCALIIGWNTVLASLGVAVGYVLIESFAFADGKIDHSIFGALIPLTLAFSGWGAALSVDSRRGDSEARRFSANQPWLLATLAILIGFAVLAAGTAKVHGGWLRSDTLATRWNLIANYYIVGRKLPVAFWAMQHFPPWVWKALDVTTVLWETGFILTVPNRTSCRVACALGSFFHFGVWQLMGIPFHPNLVTYGAFVAWAFVWPAATTRFHTFFMEVNPKATLLLCATPFAIAVLSLLAFGSTPDTALHLPVVPILLLVSPVFGAAYLVSLLKRGPSPDVDHPSMSPI
jgi:hypothetical protein